MSSFSIRPPKALLLLAALGSLTLLTGCAGDDEYAHDYWTRPNYSYAHNGDYQRAHADHIHSLCQNPRDRTRPGTRCYARLHPRNLNYGFFGY